MLNQIQNSRPRRGLGGHLKSQLEKIVVNSGIGRLSQLPNFEEKVLPELMKEFALITGQRPATRIARQSIAGFKIRAGQIVGLKADLRSKRMVDFFQKLVKVVLPRMRDFRGINLKSIDNRGNLNIGFREQMVFPEISPEQSHHNYGLEVTIVPKQIKNRDKAIDFYREMNLPLQKNA